MVVSPFSSEPLYAQIADDIRMKILSGELLPGDKIPPETELCDIYHVSRITVRGGISRLVSEKLLVRKRAKGTFVNDWDRDEPLEDHLTVAKSLPTKVKELDTSIETISAKIDVLIPNSKIRRVLKIHEGEKAMRLIRIRGSERGSFGLFNTWFYPFDGFPLDSSSYYGSFTTMLHERGIVVDRTKDCIEAIRPTQEVQAALNVSANTPILERTKTSWQSDGNYREYSECFYVGDQYKYYVDFS